MHEEEPRLTSRAGSFLYQAPPHETEWTNRLLVHSFADHVVAEQRETNAVDHSRRDTNSPCLIYPAPACRLRWGQSCRNNVDSDDTSNDMDQGRYPVSSPND